ncbi:MAG: A/G-specific adenine glycosylase [Candidatus Jacksonbacteria bacterium]|jgi:A/G-specific adenine glycosylase|nr:A/G-specific adenine glycosylase [Candidatus Jacksonbacteria bacterium]MBT6034416.1 A/G-specific adenine glycosylase [Candidatus Jacksonbacteria bacterium]MBT6301663.1 A/G-specific adenine glycosylase [Candidatus Jacksonbacteria bacterium]MBT6757448.1 A/G-specific adenine glycosylase [Candidatus Jacksonbacteria bacterium]MBT6954972.1 A/G-specific adenine glycosylase [Candidatus Jacksonbacteria bacterium]
MISIPEFQKKILSWYKKNGRHNLPWRKKTNQTTYRILVSELMLQQTQVDRVIPKYTAFLKKFPTAKSLSQASTSEVLKEWQGLGYNRRALNLQKASQYIQKELKGRFPKTIEELEKLPGVGPYTARAVSVFSFNNPEVFIETNIRRIFIHFFFSPVIASRHSAKQSRDRRVPAHAAVPRDDRSVSDDQLMPWIEKALYTKNPRMWYSALMDYGALAMKDIPNPNKKSKHYTKQSKFEGSRRYARAKLVTYLLEKKSATTKVLEDFFTTDKYLLKYQKELVSILRDLEKEGFIKKQKQQWQIVE